MIFTHMGAIKIGDIVWFQSYKRNYPVQGRVTRIGTRVQLQIGWRDDDERIFYELETLKDRPFVFTTTTAQSLFREKPSQLSLYSVDDDKTGKSMDIMAYDLEDALRISKTIDFNEYKNHSIIDTYEPE